MTFGSYGNRVRAGRITAAAASGGTGAAHQEQYKQ